MGRFSFKTRVRIPLWVNYGAIVLNASFALLNAYHGNLVSSAVNCLAGAASTVILIRYKRKIPEYEAIEAEYQRSIAELQKWIARNDQNKR